MAIDSAAVKGVLTLPWSNLKSAYPVLKSPANNNRAVALSLEEFRYRFTNTLSEGDYPTRSKKLATSNAAWFKRWSLS